MEPSTSTYRGERARPRDTTGFQPRGAFNFNLATVDDGSVRTPPASAAWSLQLQPSHGQGCRAIPETVYKIGSVSKQLIATCVMLLIQEGKMSLDDRISKFLEGTPDTWTDITVRQLLTHTSGIVREAPGFDPLKVQNDAIKTAYPLPRESS